MRKRFNILFFLSIFLCFSYEVMASQPPYTKIAPIKKISQPIKVYSTQIDIVSQLNVPEITSPRNDSTFNHYPRALTLRWRPVSNAVAYNVEIDCMNCCAARLWCADVDRKFKFIRELNETFYKFNFVGAQPGRWRVQAIDENGKVGKLSQWIYFRFTR